MKELFLSILMVSLMCSLLLAPLLVFTKKLQGRYAAKTLYFLWLLLAIRMLLPNGLLKLQAPVTVEMPAYDVTIPAMPPAAPEAPKAPTAPWSAGAYDTATTEQEVTVTVTQTVELIDLAAAVWAAGVGVFLLWQMIAYFIARGSILRESCPATDDEWALLGRLCADLGVGKALNLCRSERVESPMLLGLFSPMVVLPDRDSDPDELEAVLRHELCHLKRGDVAYKSFFLLVNALHWFNPLVWLMARAAARNVEFCCDDQVLRHADGPTRKHYGEVLLYTAAGSIYPAFSTHFGSGKEQLKERLLNLFMPKKNSALLVCTVAAVALLAGGAVAFESGRSNMPFTLPLEESATPTETPMPVPTPELGTITYTYETFYALWPSITGNTISDDYETVTFQVADYEAQNGTITGTGEERTLTMADDVRLARDVAGNALWAGEKGTIERQRALLSFFGWPMLRSQAYPGRTDYIEVTVENGQVVQMALLMTPEVGVTGDILNLPWVLYEECPVYEDKNVGRSAGVLNYSMNVEEPMDFTITVEKVSGVFEFGVKEGNKLFGGKFLYGQREFGSETDTFHLEPGYYDIVVHMEAFQGSYHLVGSQTREEEASRTLPMTPTPIDTPNSAINLPVEGTPEVTVEPLPPDTGDSKTVIELSSKGGTSLMKSASFTAKAGQTLTLTITSDISGGTVDLFLFSPAGQEQRVTVGGEDATKTITLTEGSWAYNCTGFFESGSVSIVGTVK